jgi:hypothetical protein
MTSMVLSPKDVILVKAFNDSRLFPDQDKEREQDVGTVYFPLNGRPPLEVPRHSYDKWKWPRDILLFPKTVEHSFTLL